MRSEYFSVRMTPALVVFLFICIFMSGCSGDDSSTGPAPEMADIDTYMKSLPAWDQFCPPVADEDAPSGETVEDFEGGLFCRTAPCSITKTPDQVVTYFSTVQITRVKYNEDAGDNDIYIRDFCFGVAYR